MGSGSDILVTGAAGQVGTALRELIPEAHFADRAELDVTDAAAVMAAVTKARVVIHLAAATDVEGCERDPAMAEAVNVQGTANVAAAAAATGARVLFTSTDYVFDGTKAGEYEETDQPSPLNVYGRTKLAAEDHVTALEGALVIRTSWVFGSGRNFVASVLARVRSDGHARVVEDQQGRPTSAPAVAEAIADLVGKSVTGIVHVSGDGPICSWADLAVEAISAAGITGRVERISTEEYVASAPKSGLARRPANSALSLAKARSLGVPLLDWRRSVHDYVQGLRGRPSTP